MRKVLKKRLVKAITTLNEPEGSTIGSIVKIINQDFPALSLRKVLEALQEGIDEGFLCMFNRRLKLTKQSNSHSGSRGSSNPEGYEQDRKKENSRDSDLIDEDSDNDLDEWEEDDIEPRAKTTRRTSVTVKEQRKKPRKRLRTRSPSKERFFQRKRAYFSVKGTPSRKKGKGEAKKKSRNNQTFGKVECPILEISSSSIPEKKSRKQTTEKPDIKKQRGPRCTSMKKEVRMPSKVDIPFVPPTVPQRSNNFNDLLRRSPEPVNGPLFDSHNFAPENIGLFGTYCQIKTEL